MTRARRGHERRALLSLCLAWALLNSGCRPSFVVSAEEARRARSLPPDAAVLGSEGGRAVKLRAGAVSRSIALSSPGKREVTDPGLNLRQAAWGVGGAALGGLVLVLPIASLADDSEANAVLVSALVIGGLTAMAIGFGLHGNLEEDEFLYSDQPLIEPDPPINRRLDVDEERRLKAEAALGPEGE